MGGTRQITGRSRHYQPFLTAADVRIDLSMIPQFAKLSLTWAEDLDNHWLKSGRRQAFHLYKTYTKMLLFCTHADLWGDSSHSSQD